MLCHPALAGTPVAAYRCIAPHSAALSRVLLTLLAALVATTPPDDAHDDAAGGGEGCTTPSGHFQADLSSLVASTVLPSLPVATALLQGRAAPSTHIKPEPQASGGAAAMQAAPETLPSARLDAMRLVLQALAALRACSVSARLDERAFTKSRGAASEEAESAGHVMSWDTVYWLDVDYLQVRMPIPAVPCSRRHLQL